MSLWVALCVEVFVWSCYPTRNIKWKTSGVNFKGLANDQSCTQCPGEVKHPFCKFKSSVAIHMEPGWGGGVQVWSFSPISCSPSPSKAQRAFSSHSRGTHSHSSSGLLGVSQRNQKTWKGTSVRCTQKTQVSYQIISSSSLRVFKLYEMSLVKIEW